MIEPIKQKYEKSGPKVVEALKKRHFDAYYVSTKEKAIKEVKEYVENGVEGTYGIVSLTLLDDNITKQDIDDGNVDVSDEYYLETDICVGYAKINNKIVELFNNL